MTDWNRRPPSHHLSKVGYIREEVRASYESGLTLAAVARKFKTTRRAVTQAIHDAGGKIRPKGTRGVPS